MPIPLGVLAVAGAGAAAAGAYELIQTVNGTGSSGTISLTNIPQTYTHLQLRAVVKTTSASQMGDYDIRFNSDSTASYAAHYLQGNGSSVSSVTWATSASSMSLYGMAAGNDQNRWAVHVTDILDYTKTSKNKTLRALAGFNGDNSTNRVTLHSGLWMNTAAITSITITTTGGTSFRTETRISLYGIKG